MKLASYLYLKIVMGTVYVMKKVDLLALYYVRHQMSVVLQMKRKLL